MPQITKNLQKQLPFLFSGADAILMHSKKSDPSDIESFMKAWNNQGPVIIVPTKYYTTPTDTFRDLGVSMVIWANHNLRAAVSAMQQVTGQIYKDQSLVNVEKEVNTCSQFLLTLPMRRLLSSKYKDANTFENRRNPVMWVFLG